MDYNVIFNEKELLDIVVLLKLAIRSKNDSIYALENKTDYRHGAYISEEELREGISNHNKWIDIAEELIDKFDNVRLDEKVGMNMNKIKLPKNIFEDLAEAKLFLRARYGEEISNDVYEVDQIYLDQKVREGVEKIITTERVCEILKLNDDIIEHFGIDEDLTSSEQLAKLEHKLLYSFLDCVDSSESIRDFYEVVEELEEERGR